MPSKYSVISTKVGSLRSVKRCQENPSSTTKAVKTIPIENIKQAFKLGLEWTIKNGILSGQIGDIRNKMPETQVSFSALKFVYGFKIRAKENQAILVRFPTRSWVRVMCTVGFDNNRETVVQLGRTIKSRFPARVTNPQQWSHLEVQMDGKSLKFFLDRKEVGKYVLQNPVIDPLKFRVGFATHMAPIQIKDVYLITDGKPLKELPISE